MLLIKYFRFKIFGKIRVKYLFEPSLTTNIIRSSRHAPPFLSPCRLSLSALRNKIIRYSVRIPLLDQF